jgi:hypothetical protein
MAKLMNYRVIREHGEFAEGATRTAAPNDVAHLVPKSLELIGPAEDQADEKADAEPDKKIRPSSPARRTRPPAGGDRRASSPPTRHNRRAAPER